MAAKRIFVTRNVTRHIVNRELTWSNCSKDCLEKNAIKVLKVCKVKRKQILWQLIYCDTYQSTNIRHFG